eukprot:TRINITY_DN10059_c0_g1_i2.p2 TRINITY_DN10059_c0_g1~~TRINITY_DN10059_c0_g1_i2.p2  ORF type:complete len:291 (+),score=-42.62 TRINITY_DN10059_c0_g1_i2:2836-3708(+)
MPGGAQGQFAAVPLNLGGEKKKAAYFCTGHWGTLAMQEAKQFLEEVVCYRDQKGFYTIPNIPFSDRAAEMAYLHFVDNETANGIEFTKIPEAFGCTLVADMSSNLLSRPVALQCYDLIYACAQKNLGIPGVTIVFVRKSLLERKKALPIPSILDYTKQVKADSLLNTPATFAWYVMDLVLDWVIAEGGVQEMDRRAQSRSSRVYDAIDKSKLYESKVDPLYRSRMNVVFFLTKPELTNSFVEEALQQGLYGIKGHRAVGGIRISLYNAMTEQGVERLLGFMQDFEAQHRV